MKITFKLLFSTLLISSFCWINHLNVNAKTYITTPKINLTCLPDVLYLGNESIKDNVYTTKNDLSLLTLSSKSDQVTENKNLLIKLSECTAFQLIQKNPINFNNQEYYEIKTRAMGKSFNEKYVKDQNKFYINHNDLEKKTTYLSAQIDPQPLSSAEIAAVNKRSFVQYQKKLKPETARTVWSYSVGSKIYTDSMQAGLLGKSATDYSGFIYKKETDGKIIPRYNINRKMANGVYNFLNKTYSIKNKILNINEHNLGQQNLELNQFTKQFSITWQFGRTIPLYQGIGDIKSCRFNNIDHNLDNYRETPNNLKTQNLNQQYKPGDIIYDLSISSFTMNPEIALKSIRQHPNQETIGESKREKALFILEIPNGTTLGSSIDSLARYGIGPDLSSKPECGGNNAITNFLKEKGGEDPASPVDQKIGSEFTRTVINNFPNTGDQGPKTQSEILIPMSTEFIVTKLDNTNPQYPGVEVIYLEPVLK
jgi:hypothetical protein